jgi:hypothetical protein
MSKSSGSKKDTGPGGAERRKFKRRPVLDTFSLFAVVPRKGPHRVPVHDISDQGLAFDLDIEGEEASVFPVARGESLEVQLYLNQSLYLPLQIQVARLEEKGSIRVVGAQIQDKTSKAYKGFLSFLTMLDSITEGAQIDARSA